MITQLRLADSEKVKRYGQYLTTIEMQIMECPRSRNIESTTKIAELYIAGTTHDITLAMANSNSIERYVSNIFEKHIHPPTKFEIEYVEDLISDSKDLFFKKRMLL